jgi:hypothetical protein
VNLQTDRNNCGKCSNACSPLLLGCTLGVCL